MKLLSGKSNTSGLGTALLKCRIIRISKLSNIGIKGFCCIIKLFMKETVEIF
jgi:hypothetical protein